MATACISCLFVGSIFTTSISPTAGVQIYPCWGSQHLHCHPSPSLYLYAAATPSRHFSQQSVPHLHFSPACCTSLPCKNQQAWNKLMHTQVLKTCEQTTFHCNATGISLAFLSTLMHNSLFKLHIFGILCLHSFASLVSYFPGSLLPCIQYFAFFC